MNIYNKYEIVRLTRSCLFCFQQLKRGSSIILVHVAINLVSRLTSLISMTGIRLCDRGYRNIKVPEA